MPFIGKQSTSNSQITNYTTTVGSGGQTNFTVVIEGGDETHVYLNGVLLKETTDYTVSSTQVSLVSPAVENDIVEIKVFRSFALVDAVRASEGGTFSGNVAYTGNIQVDDIIEKSTAHGVEIEGVLLKDSIVQADDIQEKTSAHGVEIDGVTLKDGGGTFTSNDGVSISAPNYATLRLEEGDATDLNTTMFSSSGAFSIYTSSDDRSSSTQRLDVNHTSGDVKVYTGNLVIGTAGKGIDFSAQTGASSPSVTDTTGDSEILNHCERGDWTPAFSLGTWSVSSNSSYARVGNIVTCFLQAQCTTASTSSNALQISQLPFPILDNDRAIPVGFMAKRCSVTVTSAYADSTTQIVFYTVSNGAGFVTLNGNSFTDTASVYASFTYICS